MSAFNVVRNGGGGADRTPARLPDLLDAVLDGELDAADPGVEQLLRDDLDAARRFRSTQRLVSKLERMPTGADQSRTILAVVHARKPFAARPTRRPVPAGRIAFAGGLLAGICLVVVLQQVSPRVGPGAVAPLAMDTATPILQSPTTEPIVRVALEAPRAPRESLTLGNVAPYEPSTTTMPLPIPNASGSIASASFVHVAMHVDENCSIVPAIQPVAMAHATAPQAPNTHPPALVWPPDDVVEWLRQQEECPTIDFSMVGAAAPSGT